MRLLLGIYEEPVGMMKGKLLVLHVRFACLEL